MSPIKHWYRAAAALSIAAAASAPVAAQSIAAVSESANWTFAGAAQVLIPGMVTPLVAKQANLRLVVYFSAECAVDGAAGNFGWTDVDIRMINALGATVMVLPPTAGSGDAFCSANGTAGFNAWENNTIIARVPFDVPAGNYRFAVYARANAGATGGWFGERALVVSR